MANTISHFFYRGKAVTQIPQAALYRGDLNLRLESLRTFDSAFHGLQSAKEVVHRHGPIAASDQLPSMEAGLIGLIGLNAHEPFMQTCCALDGTAPLRSEPLAHVEQFKRPHKGIHAERHIG